MKISDKRALAALRDADVILGTDPDTGNQAIFYGRDRIERVAATGEAQDLRIANFSVAIDGTNAGNDEAQRLAMMVQLTKGSHCYLL